MIYTFWNNKGGTGKTSLAFQTISHYALQNSSKKILAIDLCPQANLSELFMGGLLGNGSTNLQHLYSLTPRKSIGGYFESRLPSPYIVPSFNPQDYITTPYLLNNHIPKNIDLIAGDRVVELQANAIATLSNNQIPGTNTWIAVIDWLKDFIDTVGNTYDEIFIDTNPSFSMYTQIAISTTERLILPVMADDSSRRAVLNAFSLVHGLNLPSTIYSQNSFSQKLANANRILPVVHLIAKNRLTQYMGPASAYASVLKTIDTDIQRLLNTHPNLFSFSNFQNGVTDIRDFQTTGVVAFAKACPFQSLSTGKHQIFNREVQVNNLNLSNCTDAINNLVSKL